MTAQSLDRLPWLLSRAAGLTALGVMVVVVILGLLSAGKVWARIGRPRWKAKAIAWHQPLAWTGLGAIILHVSLLYFDPWLKPGIRGLLAPFTLHKLPTRWWAELGTVSLLLIVMTIISFYARRSMKDIPGGWKTVHKLGWLAGTFILLHALGSGTELAHGWPRTVVLGIAGLLAIVFGLRLALGRKTASAASRT